MTLPNFLIIGAAKSGTTSLFNYLSQHPQVYTKAKEPGFFAYEGYDVQLNGPEDQVRFENRVIQNKGDYEDLFADITTEKAYGEASVAYLYIDGTAERIKRLIPNVRLIVILRNPVDRAFSSYKHMRRDGRDPLPDFSEALREEEIRTQRDWDYIWHYTKLGCYYKQLQAYYDRFSADQIAVFLFEEFQENPTHVIQTICRFLEIDETFTPNTSLRYNTSGSPRFRSLHRFVSRPNRLKGMVRPFVPLTVRKELGGRIKNWNVNTNKMMMMEETRRQLQQFYYDDILQLQTLIEKDLSGWLIDDID